MKKVLVVDDSLLIREYLKIVLEQHEFEVVGEAKDGNEALEKYKELSPDVVTMDILMPRVDGIKAIQEIKEYDSQANIVVVSSANNENDIKKAIIQGAKSIITKPFNEEMLIKTLNLATMS
ncbi:MAG: response regulator [Ignavibacteriales bacterium]